MTNETHHHEQPATEADEIRSDRIHEPATSAEANTDQGEETDAERLAADGLQQKSTVSGLTGSDDGHATEAERIGASGLHQGAAVEGLSSSDDGLETDADRLRAADLPEP